MLLQEGVAVIEVPSLTSLTAACAGPQSMTSSAKALAPHSYTAASFMQRLMALSIVRGAWTSAKCWRFSSHSDARFAIA